MFNKFLNFHIFTISIYFIFAIIFYIPCVNAKDNSSHATEERQILILIGPHYGLPMLEAIIPATVNMLKENGFSLDDIFVEFLELHRQSTPQHRYNILTLLEHKLANSSVGLIIAVNQGAVDFIAKDGSDLLPGVPVLIPILEKLPSWEGEPRKLITLTTRQDAEGTLSYALSLFPATKRVLLIMGKDDYAAPFVEPVLKALEDRGNELETESTADISYEMMLERIASLSPDTIAFYGSYFHDITGRSFIPAEVAAQVSARANCPVFAFRDMHIAQGLTGGSVTITSDLGKEAAHISLKYLSGNLKLELPVTTFEVPSLPLFDWVQLKRWGADVHQLPSNTLFLNQTPTLWSQHKEAVLVALASIVLLLLILCLLIFKINQLHIVIQLHNKTVTKLKASEARYRHLFEAANVGKSVTLPTGEISVNNAYCDMLGYTSWELHDITWQQLTPAEDINLINKILAPLFDGQKDTARFEKRYIHKNGFHIWADVSTVIQRDEKGKALYFITTVVDITEQKRAEEHLQKFKQIISSTADGISLLDKKYCYVITNKAYEAFSGKKQNELIGISVAKYLGENIFYEKVKSQFDRCLKGETIRYQDWFDYPTLGKRFVEITYYPYIDAKGDIAGVVANTSDITKHKQAEELLCHSEHRYQSLFENMNAGFVLFEVMFNEQDIPVDLLIINANSGFATTTGLELSEAIGKPLTQVLPGIESDAADWIGTYGKIAMSGESQQFEQESEFLGFYYSINAFQAEKNVCAVTFIDITDHKKSEIILRETNRRLEAFLHISQIINSSIELPSLMQMIVDNATRIMHLGSGAIYVLEENDKIRLFATTPALPNDLPEEFVIASLDEHPHIKKAITTGFYVIMEDSVSATLTPAEYNIVKSLNLRSILYLPIRLREKSIGILILCSTDNRYTFNKADVALLQGFADQAAYVINNTRSYEEAIAHTSELEQHIVERNRAEDERSKLQAQLAQAQKMESVGRLAGGVAHDFNNMMGVILGHTEIAIEQLQCDDPFFTVMEDIQKAALRSTDLTRQLLTFARKQTVIPQIFDLNDILADILKLLRQLIGEHITLDWKPCLEPCHVKMDPTQLDQILANLCINARDAIIGIGKIIISTKNISFDEAYCTMHAGFILGDYILLSVSDNGCGMDSETLARIFEPFFTTKDASKGTGLGLATVYGAVKQNQGHINVYSEPGHGTTFIIYLPRHQEVKVQRSDTVMTQTMLGGSETILLVEDESQILKVTTMLLEKLGYTVIAASTPGEAINWAKEHAGQFDLLMTDLIMPEMNGRDLAKLLLSIYPEVTHLFMSGHTADFIGHQGILDESEQFIQKPFLIKDLAAKLREVLSN